MKRKSRIVLLLFTMILICCIPVSANAMSAANKKAHKAFTSQLKKDKKRYCDSIRPKLKYAYADIDGDKVDELITVPGFGVVYQIIYYYKNGKIRNVASVGQGSFTKYYPKQKVIYVNKSGHMGSLCDYYLKYTNGKYKVVARAGYYYGNRSYSEKPITTGYHVNNKAVSKKSYTAYIKKITKGEKGKTFKSLKWKKY